VIDEKKAQGAMLQLKTEYLKCWKFEDLKELCREKGIQVVQNSVNPYGTESAINTTPLTFYEVIALVAKNVNSRELVFFARVNKLEYQAFEKKAEEIKAFYGIK